MLPLIALVGRPNVGKSTLFNRLTRTRDALVADTPGVTRDRLVGRGAVGDRPYLVVDTGGLGASGDELSLAVEAQALAAAAQADAIILVTDARAGMLPEDARIAAQLRTLDRPLFLAANKSEGLSEHAAAEFHALGLGEPEMVSASHGEGVSELAARVLETLPEESSPAPSGADEPPVIAIVGRPNAGKSTLVNRLCGEQRVIASSQAGTTRDRVRVPLTYRGRDYVLLDTPGVRRKARVEENLEKLSVVKALQAIEDADVAVLLLDATVGPTEQDARIAAYAAQHARGVVLAINKADTLSPARERELHLELERILPFLEHVPRCTLSGLNGDGLPTLLRTVLTVHARAATELPTPQLTRLLEQILERNPPPMVNHYRPRLRYAHQGGRKPVSLVLHGTRIAGLPDSYVRYLEKSFRAALGMDGVPLRIILRQGVNPYVGASGAAQRRSKGEPQPRRAPKPRAPRG